MHALLVLLATLTTIDPRCSAEKELARAASAYRNARSLTDVARIQVQVPGAPKHEESVQYGLTADRVFMRMPATYAIELRRNRFVIVEEDRRGGYVSAAAGADLQASLDAVFDGGGSPVIPPPVLLRRARNVDEQMQAFRLKVLGRLGRPACANGEVTLLAENGSVRFHVGDDGWIREIRAEIATAPGKPPITAIVRLAPRIGQRPPAVAAHGRAVRRVSELASASAAALLPDISLHALDGASVPLRNTKGRTTVIEFWATWCAPCRVTLPKVAAFARSRKDIRVLLVNLEENPALIRSFLAGAGIDLQTVVDPNGSLHKQLGGGLPLTIIVSGDGRIVKRSAGFDSEISTWLAKIGKD